MSAERTVEVQGIVAQREQGVIPLVQFRAVEAGEQVYGWQQPPDAARVHAHLVIDAAANAVYEAAFLNFMALGEGRLDEQVAMQMLTAFREHRQDTYGVEQPKRWWVS